MIKITKLQKKGFGSADASSGAHFLSSDKQEIYERLPSNFSFKFSLVLCSKTN